MLYCSLVLPHIDYVDTAYVVATKEELEKLQLIQNMACRVILKAGNRESVANMCKELGLLDLEMRRNMHLSFTFHKTVHTNGRDSLSKFFIPVGRPGRRITRHGNEKNMTVPRVRTNKGRCGICFRGPLHDY